MSTVEVRAASERDQQAVIDVITLAFSTDPMTRWTYPNPQTYLAIMPETIKAFGGNGFAHGTVHLVDGGGAAAMWLPPGVQPDSKRLEVLTKQQAPPERQADMTRVFEQMGRFHPEEPCWYLPLIGVDPACQGRAMDPHCSATRSSRSIGREPPHISNRRTRATCRCTSGTDSRSSEASRPARRRPSSQCYGVRGKAA